MYRKYLAIEPFMQNAVTSRFLQYGLECGLIARLESHSLTVQEVEQHCQLDPVAAEVLISALSVANVVQTDQACIRLTNTFRDILPFCELLQVKLQVASLVASDFMAGLPVLLRSEQDFMRQSQLFELFDYGRCNQITEDNCRHAVNWMRYTTMLTRYEAGVCCQHTDLSGRRRMLDIGGNSGEFAAQLCGHYRQLHVTVADLPVVCHIGRAHIQQFEQHDRISFMEFDIRKDAIPHDFDLITFKSFLHDWPDEAVQDLIHRCSESLPPGGQLLIFERCRTEAANPRFSWGQLPLTLFFRSWRAPETYVRIAESAGLRLLSMELIPLDQPFLLLTVEKPVIR